MNYLHIHALIPEKREECLQKYYQSCFAMLGFLSGHFVTPWTISPSRARQPVLTFTIHLSPAAAYGPASWSRVHARKAGSSAIHELAVIVVLYFFYTPFHRTARSEDEACNPTDVLIPFPTNLSEKGRRQLLVSLGNALVCRIGFDRGKDCLQLVNVLYDQLPKSHDQRPTEDACILLLSGIAERGMQSTEAFLSNRSLLMQSTERE